MEKVEILFNQVDDAIAVMKGLLERDIIVEKKTYS